MKVALAIDSFKGCLSSVEAEIAAEQGIKMVSPDCEVLRFPIADGGEGILDVLVEATHGTYRKVIASDPLMRPIETRYGVSEDGITAFIEMAAISGLPLLAESERNPMLTTTYGTGELILHALETGCREFIIGIGRSATNDAGLGMLQALGFRFLDKEGETLGTGGQILNRVVEVDFSSVHPALKDSHFTIACDVRNPFCGREGAAYIFARQKGADDAMIAELDAGMASLSKLIHITTRKNITSVPGAGAAGGLGGAFLAFLNSELKPGIELLLQTLNFSEKIKDADLIITGEGKVDCQSVMGKVPSGILEEAKKLGIPVVVIAGSVEDTEVLNQAGFCSIFSIVPAPVSLETAMKPEIARKNISRTVAQIISLIDSFQIQKKHTSE